MIDKTVYQISRQFCQSLGLNQLPAFSKIQIIKYANLDRIRSSARPQKTEPIQSENLEVFSESISEKSGIQYAKASSSKKSEISEGIGNHLSPGKAVSKVLIHEKVCYIRFISLVTQRNDIQIKRNLGAWLFFCLKKELTSLPHTSNVWDIIIFILKEVRKWKSKNVR